MLKRYLKSIKWWLNYYYLFVANYLFKEHPKVISLNKTLEIIINNRLSVSRFGDGEFLWMINKPANDLETNQPDFSLRLYNSFKNCNKNMLICIPGFFHSYNILKYTKRFNTFAMRYLIDNYKHEKGLFDMKYKYGDAFISRYYMCFKQKNKNYTSYINKIKLIWNERNVIIVEGKNVKFGIGNNLTDNMQSIRRIVCPPTNCFRIIDDIKKSIIVNYSYGDLVLLILGPSASIIATELNNENNFQCIDIGQLDMEYLWQINHCKKPTSILYKTNYEVTEPCDNIKIMFDEIEYRKQIIKEFCYNG